MASFRNYENQLKNHLLGKFKDPNEIQAAMRKYGNIRFSFNHEKYDRPHFIVKMGISEAVFDIDSGVQLGGGLGPDGNEIKNWIQRSMKKNEIKSAWQMEHKAYELKKELEAQQEEEERKKKELRGEF